MINSVTMNGKHKIIPISLKKQILDQLHINHMGTEKTQLLARESVSWIEMNADTVCVVKQCAMCLKYRQTQLLEKV